MYYYLLFAILLFTLITIYWMPKRILYQLKNLYPAVIFNNTDYKNILSRSISLTFDDVPYDNSVFNKIVDRLDQYDYKATFFVIGTNRSITSEQKKSLVKAIKNGHQIGNHGITNSQHIMKDNLTLGEEIIQCDYLIKKLYQMAGVSLPRNMVYRPGCGFFNQRMINLVTNLDYKVVLGSVYPHDPISRSVSLNSWFITKHISHGDIVILHDRDWTIKLLDKLLPELSRNKYQSITLDDLL